MEVGMRVNLEMECRVDTEFCTEREAIKSMRVRGIMGCSMVRAPSTFRMVRDTKEHLKKTNSMERVYFIRMTP